jgi:hypothetical protein
MARRRTAEERYKEKLNGQQRILEEFAGREIEWADDLLLWYRVRKRDIPDDEYRGVAFFKNREFLQKPGSLTLLYSLWQRMARELPPATKEIAFDLLAFRFRMYAAALSKGGFDG